MAILLFHCGTIHCRTADIASGSARFDFPMHFLCVLCASVVEKSG